MGKVIDDTNLGYLVSKAKATFWPKSGTLNIGLDEMPTENSDNLVKSGGVFDAIEDVIEAIDGSNVETVTVLPTASASTVGKIYYVGPDGNGEYARYRGIESGGSYSFLPLGSTAMDLTDYATKEEVSQLSQEPVNLSSYTAVRAYPNPTKWIVNNNTYPLWGIFIPLPDNVKSISVVANSTQFSAYGLLKTNTYTNNATVNYATGCTRMDLPAGTSTIDMNVPSDAKYLWVYTANGLNKDEDHSPSSVGFNYQVLGQKDIADDLVTEDPLKILSARQGAILRKLAAKMHVAPKRTITPTKVSATVSNVLFSLFTGCRYKIKVTLSASSNGDTYFQGGNGAAAKSLFYLSNGETTKEVDLTLDATYAFCKLYTPGGQDHSAASVEITPLADVTGNDGLANMIPIGYYESNKEWWASVVRFRVQKGNVLYFSACATNNGSGTLVEFRETFAGSPVLSLTPGYSSSTFCEGYVTFDRDGYLYVKSTKRVLTPQFILYANKPLNEDFVVAASNTPTAIADTADAICTGTNDEVVLNNYIEGAKVIGKKVKLLRGDYYLDEATKTYQSSNDTFLLIDTSPINVIVDDSYSVVIVGESWCEDMRPCIHISDTAYESLGSTQYSLLAVKDSTNYGGHVELTNIRFQYPDNQKKICAIDFYDFGGYARLNSIYSVAYTDGYDGQHITISSPPKVAVEGCIGIRFIGKGPNGTYGSEMKNVASSGFYEGISINTEWTVCNHVISIFCVYGWVFGKYKSTGSGGTQTSSSTHPIVLICCGDERNVNLPSFYFNSGRQQIEMIAFSFERNANNTPGGVLGDYATEETPGSFRGSISYTCGQGSGNNENARFWEYGHGHNVKTVNAAQKPSGTSEERNGYYVVNYLQEFYDTTVGKLLICVDEENRVWKDTMGNTIN